MSHITIIISRVAPTGISVEQDAPTEVTYQYKIPVPHGASPIQVGELVRKAYKKLEGWDPQAET